MPIELRVWGVLVIVTVLIVGATLASPLGYWVEKKFNERFGRH